MTGANKASKAPSMLVMISWKSALGAFGRFQRFAENPIATIIAIAIKNPGTKPAKKSLLTDTPVNAPYRTKGILGGITGPMVDADATIAAETFWFKTVVHHCLMQHLAQTCRVGDGGTGHSGKYDVCHDTYMAETSWKMSDNGFCEPEYPGRNTPSIHKVPGQYEKGYSKQCKTRR